MMTSKPLFSFNCRSTSRYVSLTQSGLVDIQTATTPSHCVASFIYSRKSSKGINVFCVVLKIGYKLVHMVFLCYMGFVHLQLQGNAHPAGTDSNPVPFSEQKVQPPAPAHTVPDMTLAGLQEVYTLSVHICFQIIRILQINFSVSKIQPQFCRYT